MCKLLVWLLGMILLTSFCLAQEGQGKKKNQQKKGKTGKDGEEEEEGFNDYEVYEAMEAMRQLTQHETFYDLMGVESNATDEQIGKSFRKLSVKYHPDKHGPEMMKMFKLVQYVSTLLRDPKRRARYEWLLHEAPAWHRESVYMMRKITKTAKISLKGALLFSFLFALGAQFLIQWIAFGIQYGRIVMARKQMAAMGEKEVKRIRKKLEQGDAEAMAQNNSDYETVLLADSPRPPFPTPLDSFIFSWLIALAKRVLPMRAAPEPKND